MRSSGTKAVVVGAAGAGLALLILGFVLFAARATKADFEQPRISDGIVVLTGGDARIAEAARLLEAGRAHRLLVSGVNRKTSREDLRHLMKLPDALFDCCVDIGYAARDTFGNADETRVWADLWRFSSLIVVTASYHMPRSMAEIALALPKAQLTAHGVVPRQLKGMPWWLKLAAAKTLAAEYLKLLPVVSRLALMRLSARRDAPAVAAGTAWSSASGGAVAARW